MSAKGRRGSIFAWPILIAAFSLVGLIAGLLGDGIHDLIAAAALGIPTLVILWSLDRARAGRWDQRRQARNPGTTDARGWWSRGESNP